MDISVFELCHFATVLLYNHTRNLFNDDCALLVHKDNDLQLMLSKLSDATILLSLTISLNKTERQVLYQPVPNTESIEPNVKWTHMTNVNSFKYIISSNGLWTNKLSPGSARQLVLEYSNNIISIPPQS